MKSEEYNDVYTFSKSEVPVIKTVDLDKNKDEDESYLKRHKKVMMSYKHYNMLFGHIGLKSIAESVASQVCESELRITESDFIMNILMSRFNSDKPIMRIGDVEIEGTRLLLMQKLIEEDRHKLETYAKSIFSSREKLLEFISDLLIRMRENLVIWINISRDDIGENGLQLIDKDHGSFYDLEKAMEMFDDFAENIYHAYNKSFSDLLLERAGDISDFNKTFLKDNSLLPEPSYYKCPLPSYGSEKSEELMTIVIDVFEDIYLKRDVYIFLDDELDLDADGYLSLYENDLFNKHDSAIEESFMLINAETLLGKLKLKYEE